MPNKLLDEAYRRLFKTLGPQHWWPGETPFEVMVGAILTQNTNWKNVEKAIANLRQARFLAPKKLLEAHPSTLANLIRPAGYFRVKTNRLKKFIKYFCGEYGGSVSKMKREELYPLRDSLLAVHGIGPETADSILLYALEKPIFVVDAYTKRVLNRHYLVPEETTYDEIQALFMDNLQHRVKLFNEYHALLVRCGKDYCRVKNPKCETCPLEGWNW